MGHRHRAGDREDPGHPTPLLNNTPISTTRTSEKPADRRLKHAPPRHQLKRPRSGHRDRRQKVTRWIRAKRYRVAETLLQRARRTVAAANHQAHTVPDQDGDRGPQQLVPSIGAGAQPEIAEAEQFDASNDDVTGTQRPGGTSQVRERLRGSVMEPESIQPGVDATDFLCPLSRTAPIDDCPATNELGQVSHLGSGRLRPPVRARRRAVRPIDVHLSAGRAPDGCPC